MFSISEGEGEGDAPSSNPPVMLKGDRLLLLSLSLQDKNSVSVSAEEDFWNRNVIYLVSQTKEITKITMIS